MDTSLGATNMPKEVSGHARGEGRRIAIVVSRFNSDVTERLLQGALRGLKKAGVVDSAVTVARVPGAVEIPLAAAKLAEDGRCDAIVALGAVIRGDTSHYDYVCKIVADGVLHVMMSTGRPVAFGVLTCDTDEQAMARSGPGDDNKGFESALVALEMASLLDDIRS